MTAQCEMNPWDQTFLGVHLQGFVEIRAGSCENGIGDSIPILILGNHRFQNFWKEIHVKIESE